MQARASQDVDFAVEQLFEVLTKPHDVQQRTVGIHVYEEIDVAVRAVIATCHGAEHPEVAGSIPRRYSEDVVASLLKVHGGIAGFSL